MVFKLVPIVLLASGALLLSGCTSAQQAESKPSISAVVQAPEDQAKVYVSGDKAVTVAMVNDSPLSLSGMHDGDAWTRMLLFNEGVGPVAYGLRQMDSKGKSLIEVTYARSTGKGDAVQEVQDRYDFDGNLVQSFSSTPNP